jgi:branched-chain amino acid transport system substrate-binding protein
VEGEAGQALAPYARAQGANAYVLAEDTATGREEAAAFRKTLSDLGGRIVGQTIGKTSFGSRLQDAKAANASVIFGAHTGADALALLDAYRVSGLTIKLIGPGSLTETADIAKLPSLPANVYTAMYYAADLDNDANRRFVSSYFKAYEAQPSGYAMAAYDSALVLNKALRQIEGGGQPTSPELNKALGLLGQIESPRGTWAFNEKRSPQQRWYLRHLRLDGMVPANLLDTNLQVLS